jgi:hypothetical protein
MASPMAVSVPIIVIATRIPPTHPRSPSPSRRQVSSKAASRRRGTRRRNPRR